MVMLVFNADVSCFQGRVLDRNTGTFKEIEAIEVLGKELRHIPRDPTPRLESDEKYARHLLVPGWDQPKLGKHKVFLAGLGGNGAVILSGLLSLGVGTGSGWIVACDPDRIEASNLPRIAYAKPSDIGKQKARVSASFARTKEPKARGYCFSCGVEDTRLLPWIKESHLLIGALDRDAPRSYLNQLSARYLIPFLDVAAEIIPGKDGCQAAGQIRFVEPGATACLVCSGSLDYSRVDPQRLSSEDLEKERRVGYIRGLDESPTPAVLDLNGVIGNLALSHFRRMVFGEPLDGREYVFYDRQQGRIVSAHLPKPNPDCPVCGRMGEIGRGDIEEETIDSGNDSCASFRVVKGKVSRESKVEEHTEKKREERQTRETGEKSSKDGHETPREVSDTSISTSGHGG
jgi:molybdopterin/thiamine biosynthesis adenylyltransferase